jgi:hypothetical protein
MPARTTLKYRLCRDRDCAKSNKSPFLNLEQSNEMECKEGPAAPKTPPRNTAEKEVRNYPEQPPVIPHTTQGYRIDINGNKCLSCYAGTCTAPHWLAGAGGFEPPYGGIKIRRLSQQNQHLFRIFSRRRASPNTQA